MYRSNQNIQSPIVGEYRSGGDNPNTQVLEGLIDPNRFPSKNIQMSSIPMT